VPPPLRMAPSRHTLEDLEMQPTHRNLTPKLEPELLDLGQRPATLGGARLSPAHSDHISGAFAPEVVTASRRASVIHELCDGSRVTFTRVADLDTVEDT